MAHGRMSVRPATDPRRSRRSSTAPRGRKTSESLAICALALTIWDRLFGTYVDPGTVRNLSFGIDSEEPTARLVLGV
jgi:hypothetical protein